jgi:hypothetical protein
MAVNKHTERSSSGDGHASETINLGLMKITLQPVGDMYNESAINLRIDSDRASLIEPVIGQFGKEPSAADKIIQLVKHAMRERGMTLLEDIGRNPPEEKGRMPEKRLKLSLADFTSYKPGGSGVTIRAESGYYEGMFNADAMMREAGDALHALEKVLRAETYIEPFEAKVDGVYKAVDMHEKSLDDAISEATRPDKPKPAILSESPEEKLAGAISKKLPEALVPSGDKRASAVDSIVKGVLCSGAACWAKAEGSDRGGENDPLAAKVRETLQSYGDTSHISDAVMKFLIGEVCDAVYADKDKRNGVVSRTGG